MNEFGRPDPAIFIRAVEESDSWYHLCTTMEASHGSFHRFSLHELTRVASPDVFTDDQKVDVMIVSPQGGAGKLDGQQWCLNGLFKSQDLSGYLMGYMLKWQQRTPSPADALCNIPTFSGAPEGKVRGDSWPNSSISCDVYTDVQTLQRRQAGPV